MISRTYTFEVGGGYDSEDMWYDTFEETFYAGDTCPQCNKGTLLISKNSKLYCSAICWDTKTVKPIKGDF